MQIFYYSLQYLLSAVVELMRYKETVLDDPIRYYLSAQIRYWCLMSMVYLVPYGTVCRFLHLDLAYFIVMHPGKYLILLFALF